MTELSKVDTNGVRISKDDRAKLSAILDLMNANAAAFLGQKPAERFAKAGLIEINPNAASRNADGEPNVRLTANGTAFLAYHDAKAERAPITPIEVPPEGFAIISGFTLPETKRGRGARTSVYPIDSLEIGQSFFVPASEANPQPWKKLSSSASSANKKYKDASPRRYFRVAEVEYNGTKGAMFARVEVPAA